MNTLNQSLSLINKQADYHINNLIIRVTITDIKSSYGHTRYLITPVTGSGSTWIQQRPKNISS